MDTNWKLTIYDGPNSCNTGLVGPLAQCVGWIEDADNQDKVYEFRITRVTENRTPREIPLNSTNFPRDLQILLGELSIAFRDGTEMLGQYFAPGTGIDHLYISDRGYGGYPVLVVEPEYLPSIEGRTGQRVFTPESISALSEIFASVGFVVGHSWNGAGCTSASFSLHGPEMGKRTGRLWLSQHE